MSIDQIKAEADAIPCEKEQRIKELERELAEALAAYDHVCDVALQCTAIVESVDGCLGADLIEACNIGAHKPALTKLLTALKVKWNCPTVERGTNRYGLDVAYFRNLFNRELNRTLRDYRPDELARNLLRMARTADKSIIAEDEFSGELKAKWQADLLTLVGYTNGDQLSYAIGNDSEEGSFYANTDGNCTIPLYMLNAHWARVETTSRSGITFQHLEEIRQRAQEADDE